MSLVFSTRFLKQSQGGGAGYTCPAGHVAVLRSVTICNRSTSAQLASVVLVGSPNVYVVRASAPPAVNTSSWASVAEDLRFVFTAGEQIAAVSDAGIDLTASGYLFSIV